MTENAFDAKGFVQIDLKSGTIQNPSQKDMALIPFELFEAVPASEALKQAAFKWGESRGTVFSKIESSGSLSMEVLAQHLQGEVALIGAGNTSVDVSGDALLVLICGPSVSYPSVGTVLEGFIAGYLSTVASQAFDGVSFFDDNNKRTVFVGNPDAVNTIRKHMANNMSFTDALAQLVKEVA